MVRNSKRRLAKYTANTNGDLIKKQIDAVKPLMVKQQSNYFAEISNIEERTKQLIENEGISPFQIANYLFFAREIYRISHKFKQLTLLSSGQERLVKWVSRGLNEDLLIKVAAIQGVTLFKIHEIVLDGDAALDDVLINKTFFNTSPVFKRIGTLELTGNALVSDVYEGKTFYKNDAKTKLTGTLPIPPTPPVSDIFGDQTIYTSSADSCTNLVLSQFHYPAWNGTLNSITARVRTVPFGKTFIIQAAIFNIHPYTLLEVTNTLTQAITSSPMEITLLFSIHRPIIKNRTYAIAIAANSSGGQDLGVMRGTLTYNSAQSCIYTSPLMPSEMPQLTFVHYPHRLFCSYTPTS